MTIVLVSIVATVGVLAFTKYASETFDQEMSIVSQSIQRDLQTLRTIAADQTNGLAKNIDIIATIKAVQSAENEEAAAEQRNRIHTLVSNLESDQRCDFFTFLCPEGKVIYRSNNPVRFGDILINELQSARETLTTRRPCVFYESTQSIRLALRAAAPVFDDAGNLLAVLTGGFRLDSEQMVDDIQRQTGANCTVFLGDERIATTLRHPDRPDERAVGTKLTNPTVLETTLSQQDIYTGEASVLGTPMKVSYLPIFNERDRETMGMIFAGIPMARQQAMVRSQVLSIIAVTIIGLVVFSGVLFWLIRSVVAPLVIGGKILRGIAEQGNIQANVSKDLLERKDEIGTISRNIERVLEDYRTVAKMTEKLASGDWQATVKPKSPEDELNSNIGKMLDDVNSILRQISNSVERVSTGAGEVSSVAQNLADGSQKTAASLEEITASMHEISGQTKMNAESAGQARDLAQGASKAATDGQEAMRDMVSAMEKITRNSSEIQRVIKVIDDIAFQTNLLALNAAVEAARAGQHGKGFAVVAEEVRNLASRSAKAARETSELIANSGTEIERGGEIAHRTSDVLNSIVDQVKQTTDLVAGIAIASNEQAQGVGQITIGLQQIDAVTQQNTAAAEESASAANEMSSMARTLRELVTQFKLRD